VKIVNVEEMRGIEQATDARGHSFPAMMDMAGQAVGEAIRSLVLRDANKSALMLVGPGNNGGDGLVAARYLQEKEVQVTVYIWHRDIKGDHNFQKLKRSGRRRGLSILWADNDTDYAHLREALQTADVVVDALLGTGVSRPIEGKLAEMLKIVKEEIEARRALPPEPESGLGHPLLFPIGEAHSLGLPVGDRCSEEDDDEDWDTEDEIEGDEEEDLADEDGEGDGYDFEDLAEFDEDEDDEWPTPRWPPLPVVAVDCPSGLNSNTGALDPAALPAELTITFAFAKWGQVQYPGAGACGILGVADIGVPADLAEGIQVELLRPADIRRRLPARPADANKGTFGKAMIVAGSQDYTGAAHLSGSAAGRVGAGLVTLAVPASLHAPLAAALPETTWLPLPETDGAHCAAGVALLLGKLEAYEALLVGPGLTRGPGACEFIERLLGPEGLAQGSWRGRLVADADCLNILSTWSDWPARLPAGSILTPHPGEMGRLTGLTAKEINEQRIATARAWASKWGHIVLLKGAHTVVAAPDGRAVVLPFATPALATAGSGDVLAGAIVGMLAQGLAPFEAATCAGYVHGLAGLAAQREVGPAGVIAGDILARLPKALRDVMHG
jgi:NAD(P)H-hydrate epimerase